MSFEAVLKNDLDNIKGKKKLFLNTILKSVYFL